MQKKVLKHYKLKFLRFFFIGQAQSVGDMYTTKFFGIMRNRHDYKEGQIAINKWWLNFSGK